ncbi:hypothetical protein BpHYR1_034412, partial [Brachionus plicatilis]
MKTTIPSSPNKTVQQLNVQFKTKPLDKTSLYNPPNVLLNFENYILGGDLNARTKQIGCVGENENGIMLERIINELDFS